MEMFLARYFMIGTNLFSFVSQAISRYSTSI